MSPKALDLPAAGTSPTARERASAELLRLRVDSRRTARAAGLRYVEDTSPGFGRVRRGGAKSNKFSYVDTHGRPLRTADELARIKALAVPPAYTDVWICRYANGHIQATGRDARGRKQYRYHARWSAARDSDKHARIRDFALELPRLRARCDRMLRKPGLSREKLLAAMLRMVDLTAIRVGNEEYARENDSFGLTTLRRRHARVTGTEVEFRFRGKSGVQRVVRIRDARLAKVVQACLALRGKQLFQYIDEQGVTRPIRSDHVNDFLRGLTSPRFSVKDFRTWSATVSVAVDLRERGAATSARAAKKTMLEAIRKAAEYLGNTPAVCRKSYVHPLILDAYLAGQCLPPAAAGERASRSHHEQSVLAFLGTVAKKSGGRAPVVALKLKRAS